MNTFAEALKKITHVYIQSKIWTIENINKLDGEIGV